MCGRSELVRLCRLWLLGRTFDVTPLIKVSLLGFPSCSSEFKAAAFVLEFLLGLRLFLPPLTPVALFDRTVDVSLIFKGIKRYDGSH